MKRIQQVLGLLICCICLGRHARFEPRGRYHRSIVTVSDDYARTKNPDGSFQGETYAFGEGGHLSGSTHDDTIDKMRFCRCGPHDRETAGRSKNYVAAKDPNQTKLMIAGLLLGHGWRRPKTPIYSRHVSGHDPEERLRFSAQRDRADFLKTLSCFAAGPVLWASLEPDYGLRTADHRSSFESGGSVLLMKSATTVHLLY